MKLDRSLKRVLKIQLVVVVVLWWIWIADQLFGLDLNRLGVYPRHLDGLWGLAFAPLIHGSFSHLMSNTLPVFILGASLFYFYPKSARLAMPAIYVGSSLGVWLFGRAAYHIGASGVTHGLMFFLFLSGILRRDKRAIAVAMMVFFLYGSMVWGIFPRDPDISFEAHFFGAVLGVVMAVVLQKLDSPRWRRRKYSWEDEPSDVEDPLIGDQWKD